MKKSLLKQSATILTLGALLGTTSAFAAIEANTELNTSAKATTGSMMNTSVNLTSSSSVETEVEKTATSNMVTTTSETRSSISLPVNISLDADLKAYENSIIAKESSVAEIDTTSKEEISVVWKHEGKLFAFIPVTVTSETRVKASEDTTTKVKTSMPWWSIFVNGVNDRSDEIDTNLEQSTAIKAYTSTQTNAQIRAQAIYEIVSELLADAKLEADANLETQSN